MGVGSFVCLLEDDHLAGEGMGLRLWLLCWGFAASESGPVSWGAEKA